MKSTAEIERRLRAWLREHYSVISYAEALALGASPKLIEHKVRTGEWIRLYRGVYLHSAAARGPDQALRAAWLATAKQGVVSHFSAAWVWGLVREAPHTPELTVRRGTCDARGHTGLLLHRSRDLDPSAAVLRKGLPVTNPLRTTVDVAGGALPGELMGIVDSVLAKQLVTIAGLEAEIHRLSRPGRDGVAVLRRHLKQRGFIGAPPPSVLEAHIHRLILSTGLAIPEVEVRFGPDGKYRIDIAWRWLLLAVEVDGYVWHFSPEQMRHDLARRNELEQRGWTVLVYTWNDVVNERARVAQEITRTYRRLSEQRVGIGGDQTLGAS